MKYLINVHLSSGEIRSDIFFDTMEDIEQYAEELRLEAVPFRKLVVYDADTKEAVRIIRQS